MRSRRMAGQKHEVRITAKAVGVANGPRGGGAARLDHLWQAHRFEAAKIGRKISRSAPHEGWCRVRHIIFRVPRPTRHHEGKPESAPRARSPQ
jgi:hypothetical protein